MRRRRVSALCGVALAAALCACGKASPRPPPAAGLVAAPGARAAAAVARATKNTTRLGGEDAAVDAASVAVAVYPGLTAATRPLAVVLVDESDWPAAIAASELAAAPLGAPILYTRGGQLPDATASALRTMRPIGAPALAGTQVIRVATSVSVPRGYRTITIAPGGGAAQLAAQVQHLDAQAQGKPPAQVIVLDQGASQALQMPAAGLAAESGAPVLFAAASSVPSATASVLAGLSRPTVYVLGAPAIGEAAVAALGRYGRVTKIPAGEAGGATGGAEATDPVSGAIAVARYSDGAFGWGVREAGHGLTFVTSARPLDAPAAAALSSHGDYAPILLLSGGGSLSPALARYLSDIQPGYTPSVPPVRAVYNHGWLIGDESAISAHAQDEIDAILEVAPRSAPPAPTSPPE
jgi:hypothetical protein